MRKILFLSLILFQFATVFADENIWTAAFYLPNDSTNSGWTENRDDFRSFGIVFKLETPWDIFFSTKFYGLTVRPDVSKNEFAGTRIDELSFSIAKRYCLKLDRYNSFYFTPLVGLFLYGDLGGSTVQNKLHENVSLPDVFINYSKDFGILPVAGLKTVYKIAPFYNNYKLPFFESELNLNYIPSYALKMEAFEIVKLKGTSEDMLFFSFGYKNDFVYINDNTVEKTADKERGFIVKYGINAGVLYFLNEIDLSTRNSTGSVGVKWRFGEDKRIFQKSDFSSEIGFSMGFNETKLGFYKFRLSPWENQRVNILFDLRYGNEKKDNFPDYRNVMQILSSGVDISLFEPEKGLMFNPFVSGMLSFVRKIVTDVNRDDTFFYMSQAVMFEAGVRVTKEIPFISSNALYGVAISDTVFLPLAGYDEKRESETVSHIELNNFIGISFIVYVDF